MNSSGSAGHVVSAATTPLCSCGTRAPKDHTEMNKRGCVLENLVYKQTMGHSLPTPGLGKP